MSCESALDEGRSTRPIYLKQIKFKCLQILINITRNIPVADTKIEQMNLIKWLEINKKNKWKNLNRTHEFIDQYFCNDAVQWYITDTFMYYCLNDVLRTDNIDDILQFAFYIVDLYNQIDAAHANFIHTLSSSQTQMTVYRGQIMLVNDLKMFTNSIGKSLSVSTFFSTTIDANTAIHFMTTKYRWIPSDQIPILYKVRVDLSSHGYKPFICISDLTNSYIGTEVLFVIGTVFNIDSVEEVSTISQNSEHKLRYWLIKLSLNNNSNDEDNVINILVFQLIEMLRRLSPYMKNTKTKLLYQCRNLCKNNNIQLLQIDDFDRNYKDDDALMWYTKDTFLYRLLNKALRTNNIEYILNFSFVILSIYDQLHHFHTERLQSLIVNENKIVVYRGQLLDKNELTELKHNIDKFITVTQYFSATTWKKLAEIYSGEGSQHPLYESILFEIDVDLSVKKCKSFAKINKFNFVFGENEVLFTPGTIFKLDSIQKNEINNNMWIIYLTLISEDKEEIVELNKYLDAVLIKLEQTLLNSPLFTVNQIFDLIQEKSNMKGNYTTTECCSNSFNKETLSMIRGTICFDGNIREFQFFRINGSGDQLHNKGYEIDRLFPTKSLCAS